MTDRTELRALTSMRGIAAWMVVLFHIRLSIAGLPQGALDILARGYLAVDFFFLLSGFVIWISWHTRLRDGGWRAVPGFWRKRIARIWPLHAVVLTGGAAMAVALAATGRHDPRQFPFDQLPMHLLLIQNWSFTDRLSWNDPAWSISCELAAYLAFPLLVAAIDWRRVPGWAVIAAIAALAVLMTSVFAGAGAASLGDEIPRLGVIRCLIEFAAGTAVAALWLRWRDRPVVPAALAALLAVALLALTAIGWIPETLGVMPGFAAALLALALTANAAANPLRGRAVHYLGEISYATYLSHFLLWIAFKLVFVSDADAVPPGLIALYLGMVLMASVLLYHLVERPAQRWINALGTPPARRPALAA